MKKHSYIIFLLIPFTLLSQTSIMSYNIRYSTENDGENWWEFRKNEVAQLIDYYSPEYLESKKA